MRGDYKGEFTFTSGQGSSVIDYCCVSSDILPQIVNFKFHFNRDEKLPLLPKLVFKKGENNVYQKRLDNIVISREDS